MSSDSIEMEKLYRNSTMKKDVAELQEGLKRNFIRIDKLKKEMELHQEKITLAIKKLVEYVDMKSQENNNE